MKLTYFAVTGLVLLLAAGGYLMMQNDMDGRMKELQADYDRKLELLEKKHKEQQATAASAVSKVAEVEGAAKTANSRVAGKVDKTLPPDGSVSEALNNVKATLKQQTGELAANGEGANPAVPVEPGDAATLPDNLLAKEQREILDTTGVGIERLAQENAELIGDVPPGKKLNNIQSLVVAQPWIAKVKDTGRPNDNADFVVLDQGSVKGLASGDSFAVRRGTAIIARVVIGDTVQENQCIANIIPEKLVTGMVLQPGDEIIKFDR